MGTPGRPSQTSIPVLWADVVRVTVYRLRRKIEIDSARPQLIVTEPGVGYRFEPPRA